MKILHNFFFPNRRKAEVTMEGQFLVRQIYDDEITYNLIGAAVEILSESEVDLPLPLAGSHEWIIHCRTRVSSLWISLLIYENTTKKQTS